MIKVGDRVTVNEESEYEEGEVAKGTEGTVIAIEEDLPYPIDVMLDGFDHSIPFMETELSK
jgi:hypothetical protein